MMIPSTEISGEKNKIIQTLHDRMNEGQKILDRLKDTEFPVSQAEWETWQTTTAKILERTFSNHTLASSFLLKSSAPGNYSLRKGKNDEHSLALQHAISFLKGLVSDIETGLYDPEQVTILTRETAIHIIRRILNNFHKHLETMYQADVHGNGTIKKADLDRIRIGNEYDVQRILFALIRPVFPASRMEVSGDAGYKSYRYDIVLDEYDLVIEVKCSRKNMKERDLTEELGADAFHYQASHLFFFLYDKEKIVSNVDAFQRAYQRDKSTFGKDVEAIVVQPITL